MKVTVSNIDKQQADWLVENTPEITVETLAEMLLARHIAEGGGPIPLWAKRKKLSRARFLQVIDAAIADHVDCTARAVPRRAKPSADYMRLVREAARSVAMRGAAFAH